MIAFWQFVWLLIAVQMVIGLVVTHLYYDGSAVESGDGNAVEEERGEGTLHG